MRQGRTQHGAGSDPANRALGSCDGSRLWLGPFTKETCGEPNRLLIRSASNAYFPQMMSVISLPERDEAVGRRLTRCGRISRSSKDRQSQVRAQEGAVKAGLEGISDDEAFAEIQARRLGGAKADKSVKVAELETLVAPKTKLARIGRRDLLRTGVAAVGLGPPVDGAD